MQNVVGFWRKHNNYNTGTMIVKLHRVLLIAAIACTSYCTAQTTSVTGPHLLVYKTRKNYRNLVAVQLSADKKTIISYPAPEDVKAMGNAILPTTLKQGYLIDNRGIDANVAFLDITYKQYAKLKSAPAVDKLYAMIKDKAPLTLLCDCGLKSTYAHPEEDINTLLAANKLKEKCKRIPIGQ